MSKTVVERIAELEQGLDDLIRAFEIFIAIKGAGPGDYALQEAKDILSRKIEIDQLDNCPPLLSSDEIDNALTEEEQIEEIAKQMAKALKAVEKEMKNLDPNTTVDIVLIDPKTGMNVSHGTVNNKKSAISFPTDVDTSTVDKSLIPPESVNVKERK